MDTAASLLPLVLLGVAFYLLVMKPARNRSAAAARSAQQVRNAVSVGADVMTTAGIYGTVRDVDDEVVHLEVAPGVVIRYARAAIAEIVSTPEEASS